MHHNVIDTFWWLCLNDGMFPAYLHFFMPTISAFHAAAYTCQVGSACTGRMGR